MTSSLDLDLSQLFIHSAPTLDLTFPLVDVGPCPDSCEPTIVGPPPPERLPYEAARCVLPDLDSCSTDELLDLAANVCADTHSGFDDLYSLCGSSSHVKALCRLLGASEMDQDTLRERIDNLGSSLADVTRRLERSDQALVITTTELYAERRAHADTQLLLRTERQRLEGEATMHHDTMKRLISQTGALHMAGRAIEKLSAEIKVLSAALEKCK